MVGAEGARHNGGGHGGDGAHGGRRQSTWRPAKLKAEAGAELGRGGGGRRAGWRARWMEGGEEGIMKK